jgi:hypothetical protein
LVLKKEEEEEEKKKKERNKQGTQYPSVSSAIRPVPHGPDVPILTSPSSQTEISSPSHADEDNVHFSPNIQSKNPRPFNQSELNDLVHDLVLTGEKTELLEPRLKQKYLLAPRTNFYWFDIPGLIHHLGKAHEPDDWLTFNDSSKRSLKSVLINSEHKIASMPVAHS